MLFVGEFLELVNQGKSNYRNMFQLCNFIMNVRSQQKIRMNTSRFSKAG